MNSPHPITCPKCQLQIFKNCKFLGSIFSPLLSIFLAWWVNKSFVLIKVVKVYFPGCQVLQRKSNVMSCLSISIFPYQLISKVQYSSTWVIYHTILLRIWNDKANHFLASLSLQNIYFLLGLFANINLNILNPSFGNWCLH